MELRKKTNLQFVHAMYMVHNVLLRGQVHTEITCTSKHESGTETSEGVLVRLVRVCASETSEGVC